MKAELFHADGRTDRYNEANSLFSQFFLKTGRSIRNNYRAYRRYKWYTNILLVLKGTVDDLQVLFTTTVLNILLLCLFFVTNIIFNLSTYTFKFENSFMSIYYRCPWRNSSHFSKQTEVLYLALTVHTYRIGHAVPCSKLKLYEECLLTLKVYSNL